MATALPIMVSGRIFDGTFTPKGHVFPAAAMKSTWLTSTPSEAVTLQLQSRTYNALTIDWGDGSQETILSNPDTISHTYTDAGTYQVEITGQGGLMFLSGGTTSSKLVSFDTFGDFLYTNMEDMFWNSNANTMSFDALDVPNTSNNISCAYMFEDSISQAPNMHLWDMSNCMTVESMFAGSNFNQDISGWDMSSVILSLRMFNNTTLFNQPVPMSWPKCEEPGEMFRGAEAFNQNLNGMSFPIAYDFESMFNGATIFNGSLNDWVIPNGEDFDLFLANCPAFNNTLNNWTFGNNFHSEVAISRFFQNSDIFNQDLSTWDTTYVTEMLDTFNGASAFNGNITGWNTSHVDSMHGMFQGAIAFNQDISGWDVGRVDRMDNTFTGATAFAQDLSGWDTSGLFYNDTHTGNFSVGSAIVAEPFFADKVMTQGEIETQWPGTGFVVSMNSAVTQTGFATDEVGIYFLDTSGDQVVIDWGDANVETFSNTNTFGISRRHTYAAPGTYDVTVKGRAQPQLGNFGTSDEKMVEIKGWSGLFLPNTNGMFADMVGNPTLISAEFPTISKTAQVNGMFQNTAYTGAFSLWDFSGLRKLTNLFSGNYNAPWIIGMDVSNAYNMQSMFGSNTIFNQDITGWVTTNCQEMSYMFAGASAFNQNISSWNTSNVARMANMFQNATAFNQPIGVWNVSKVTSMDTMFASSGFNSSIAAWTPLACERISRMFDSNTVYDKAMDNMSWPRLEFADNMFLNATAFNSSMLNWNAPMMKSMNSMFEGATSFNQPLDSWTILQPNAYENTGAMYRMFYGATAFNQDISGWDMRMISDHSGMFEGAVAFNQNIGSWIVAKSTGMARMFFGATAFNQDLSGWEVGNIDAAYKRTDFDTGSSLTAPNLPAFIA